MVQVAPCTISAGKLTQISDLTVKMVGNRAEPKLKTKAAETWGVALFLIDELRKYGARAGEDTVRLALAGECLRDLARI